MCRPSRRIFEKLKIEFVKIQNEIGESALDLITTSVDVAASAFFYSRKELYSSKGKRLNRGGFFCRGHGDGSSFDAERGPSGRSVEHQQRGSNLAATINSSHGGWFQC